MALASREERGLAIAKSAKIRENEDGSFSVPSQSREGAFYTVKAFAQSWVCDCPDFLNRADEIDACKHIVGVRLWIAARTEIQSQPRPKVFAPDAVQCPKCASIRVVKYGRANAKQVFKCRDCKTKFREGLIKRAKYSPETITLTLDLYFSGLSLRKICRTLNDHFDMTLTPMTVYRWIRRFVPQVSEYVASLRPQLSETWHADEVFVKTRGGSHIKNAGVGDMTIGYLWNVMDRKTRFLLASKLTKFRDVGGADRAFKQAVQNAHGSEPKSVYTDALYSYRDAIKFGFKGKVEHIAKAGLHKPHATNNRIERLNGTVRERTKVQRGWKSLETVLPEGQRLQYDFVKPHQALAGQTPAEAAGVGVQGRNKWLMLIRRAIEESREAS